MGIFSDKDENETVESTDAAEEIAATDEAPTEPETEVVAETVESEGGMIKWEKPSGVEIKTNSLSETVAYAESLGWKRK